MTAGSTQPFASPSSRARTCRERRDAQQDLHQPVVELREEERPERLGALDLELVEAVDLEQLLGAHRAQTLLRRHVDAREEFVHRQRVRWCCFCWRGSPPRSFNAFSSTAAEAVSAAMRAGWAFAIFCVEV